MPAGARHVLGAAAAVFLLAFALPAGALANGGGKCNASACKVYIEPNLPNAGKQQQGSSGGMQFPKKLRRVLAQAGQDKGPLLRLVTGAGPNTLQSGGQSGTGSGGAPGILGAILDLGGGPTALLTILLASALALGIHSRTRGWWPRRPSP